MRFRVLELESIPPRVSSPRRGPRALAREVLDGLGLELER